MTVSAFKLFRFALVAVALVSLWVASLFLADYIASNNMARNIVGEFGYLGVLVMSIIAGINVLLPIPAATFVPVFTAAGLWLPMIIAMLVIGTTIADFIGYFIGRWSREFAEDHYPRTYKKVLALNEMHSTLLLPFVFAYAAFVPFPNEAIIIPMAIVGIRFKAILIPLVLGNILNQTALALGATNIFELLF